MTVSPHTPLERLGWKVWVAVSIGGLGGAEVRYLLGVLFPEPAGSFPWTTLTINVAGSFLLGWLTALWAGGRLRRRWVQAGLGPGLIGSFTTFSAVALTAVTEPALFLPYLGGSVVLGLAAAAAGTAVAPRSAR
jgi:fluoride exporter